MENGDDDIRVRQALENCCVAIKDLSAEQVAEVCSGLVGIIRYRAEKERGIDHSIGLLDSLSSFTAGCHIEARRRKN